ERLEAGGHFAQPLLAVVDGTAVVGGEQEEANRLGLMAGQQIAKRARALRFADLAVSLGLLVVGGAGVAAADLAHFARGLHQAVVQPVFDEGLAVGALALRQLVFMVREDEIEAAAVNVKGFAEVMLSHRRSRLVLAW